MKRFSSVLIAAALTATLGCKSSGSSDTYWSSTDTNSGSNTSAPAGGGSNSSGTSTASQSARSNGGSSVSLAYPTGNAATSSILLEKFAANETVAGTDFSYEIQVTNLTDIDLENVQVTEQFDQGFTVKQTSPKSSMKNNATQWTLGVLPAGASKTIRVMGTPGAAGSFSTCSSVTYNTALCTTIDVVKPALELMASGPANASQCDELKVRYAVKNSGTGTARDVVVQGTLPNGLKTKTGSSSFSKNIGNLSAGQSKNFDVSTVASATGTYAQAAKATASGGLTVQSNTVSTVVTKPMLEIAMSAPERQFAGRSINYQIVVNNKGNGPATGAVVEAAVPAGSRFASATEGGRVSGGKVRWTLGDLAPGASKTLGMKLKGEKMGRLAVSSTANADCADAVRATASTELSGIPAILMEVIDLEDPIEVGSNVTYEISVTNQGSAPGTGIRIVCTLPDNVSYVDSSGVTTRFGPRPAHHVRAARQPRPQGRSQVAPDGERRQRRRRPFQGLDDQRPAHLPRRGDRGHQLLRVTSR